MTIRILCYNIHGGYNIWRQRVIPSIGRLLDDLDIDIAVFQEFETRPSRGGAQGDIDVIAGKQRAHHYHGLTLAEEGGWYGNLLVSRYPILYGCRHDLQTPSRWEPRNAIDVLIDTPIMPLRIIGTHLSLTYLQRLSEVRVLTRLLDDANRDQEHPMILMGDINEWRGGTDLMRHLDELFVQRPCGLTFPASFPVLKLDRVWTHRLDIPIKVNRVITRRTRTLSDHLPVLIELGE